MKKIFLNDEKHISNTLNYYLSRLVAYKEVSDKIELQNFVYNRFFLQIYNEKIFVVVDKLDQLKKLYNKRKLVFFIPSKSVFIKMVIIFVSRLLHSMN